MSTFAERVELGKTGLSVSRLGLGASFGAPSASYREAFDRGVNYFYWGSLRRKEMGTALRELAPRHREQLVLVIQSYSRLGWLMKRSLESALSSVRTDYADVLLLGWFNTPPPRRLVDAALDLQAKGRVRHVAVSSHRRAVFAELHDEHPQYSAWHVRYNACHRGFEREVAPRVAAVPRNQRPGIVSFTNTRWGHLCDPRRMPPGVRTPTGTDCYRFALSHPLVDVALSGPDDAEHMRQALAVLDSGPMSEEDLAWMRAVGDHVYGKDLTAAVRDGARS